MARRDLGGELLHFGGDDRKAASGFAGARGFDGGVEGEQVDLRGDVVDQLDDAGHLFGGLGEGDGGGVGRAA